MKLAGLNVVYDKANLPLPVATDETPYVQAMMTSNNGKPPAVIDMALGIQNALGLVKGLKQAGYKGDIFTIFYASQLVGPLSGTYAGQSWATPEATAPAMQQIVSTLKAGGVTSVGIGELAAYYGADYFVKLIEAAGPNLTPQHLQQVASTYKYEIPGVVGPSYMPQGWVSSPSCQEIVHSDGTKWTVAVPYTCASTEVYNNAGQYSLVPYPSGVKWQPAG
jgi:hypothetical protein